MKNWLVPFFIRCLGFLPLSVSRVLGSVVGFFLGRLDTKAARITQINLGLCFPALTDAERKTLARRSLVETAKTGVEAAAIWRNDSVWLSRQVREIEGLDLLRGHLAAGKGVLVLAPHLGNWEVIPALVAQYGPFTAMYQPPKQPGLDKLMLAGRSKPNITMAPTNRKGVMQLFKALQRGEMVGILPDQVPDPGNGAEVAPFFGIPAQTMTLAHSLVSRTGCVPLCIYAQRLKRGFKLVIRPAEPGLGDEDIQRSVAALNASVEVCVRAIPAQYQWEYKRFRRLPAGYPDYYPRRP